MPARTSITTRCLAFLLNGMFLAMCCAAQAQTESATYIHRQSFGVFTSYSPNSNHILLGNAEQRRILNIGFSYSHKLIANTKLNWQFDSEFAPISFESDPRMKVVIQELKPETKTFVAFNWPSMTRCHFSDDTQYTTNDGIEHEVIYTYSCHGRDWTMGEALSPFGMRLNLRPQGRLQPVLLGHGGYLFSTHAVPTAYAGAFNFRFDMGAGFEFFQTSSRSIRLEYRYQHISNKDTALTNPGIDSQVLHVGYIFGR